MNGGLNTYGYVGGNPLSYVDPFGLNPSEEEWMLEQRIERDINTDFLGELLAEELTPYGTAKDTYDFCEDPSLLNAAGFVPFAGAIIKRLPNSDLPDVVAVDAKGNAIPLKDGEHLTASPDGKWKQVRDADGNPTGTRIDGGHNPNTHSDPRALEPHGHVPGVTNPDGTPWLRINQ